jgi:hypothetical protein
MNCLLKRALIGSQGPSHCKIYSLGQTIIVISNNPEEIEKIKPGILQNVITEYFSKEGVIIFNKIIEIFKESFIESEIEKMNASKEFEVINSLKLQQISNKEHVAELYTKPEINPLPADLMETFISFCILNFEQKLIIR